MRVRDFVLAICLAGVWAPVLAGGFVELPTTAPLRKFGAQNPAADRFKLADGVQTGDDYAPPSNLTQLDARQTDIIYQGNKVGTLFDYVFRDTNDDQLVLCSRVVLEPLVNGQGNIFEINDFYRAGNTGFTVAAAWALGSNFDLRMYSAARTAKDLLGGADTFDPDVANMRSDINVSEGNPRSGYYCLKTNAPYYKLASVVQQPNGSYKYGFKIRQSGEEQQPKTDIYFDGFVPSSTPPTPPTAARGDLQGDGRSDILWRHSVTGQNIVWFMDGAARIGTATLSTVDTSWTIVGQGDFNADGKADLFWRRSSGETSVWLMDGAARLAAGSPGTVTDANWEVVAVADFDGNGKADVLWRHKVTGQNIMWFMNGTARAGTGTVNTVADANWKVAGVGDFDGDGHADILWRNAITGQNILWRMNAATKVEAATLSTVSDPNWKVASVADFDGDGKADVLWRNSSTGQDILWFMDGTVRSSTATLSTVATTWSIVATGDYNADSMADILWRSTTGQNVLWLMNGATRLSATTLSAVADTGWLVVAP